MRIERPCFEPAELREIIAFELDLHPLAGLADIYKLLNQAYYGPTHMDPSPERVIGMLEREYEEIASLPSEPFQDIGCGRGFFRISLPILQDLKVDMERAAELILASRLPQPPEIDEWEQLWQQALPVVASLTQFSPTESEQIHQILKGGWLPRHTETYRQHYHPHYRVIHVSQLELVPQLSTLIRSNS